MTQMNTAKEIQDQIQCAVSLVVDKHCNECYSTELEIISVLPKVLCRCHECGARSVYEYPVEEWQE